MADEALSSAETHLPNTPLWLRYTVHYWRGIWMIRQYPDDPTRALPQIEQAITELEQLTARLLTEYRPMFLTDKQMIYEDAVDLYLASGDFERALEYTERAKSRALLDLLAQRLEIQVEAQTEADQELVKTLHALQRQRNQWYRRQQVGEDDVNSSQRKQPWHRIETVEQQIAHLWSELLARNATYTQRAALWRVTVEPIHDQLKPNELLIEYFVVHGQLIVFLLSKQFGLQIERLAVPYAQVEQLLISLERNLRTTPHIPDVAMPHWKQRANAFLQKLDGYLLAPIRERVQQHSHLLIVPHGCLHHLPFHALHDGQHYLIEQVTVSQLPSASVLRFCRESADLGSGLITFGHAGHNAKIPHAEAEAQQIAERWGGTSFLDTNATLSQFKSSAPTAAVLHLSMHGHFNATTPLLSSIRLHDQDLTTLELFNMRLNANLVVLSACSTGQHQLSGGDELVGLMRGFLSAGAASLVLSLWAVEDRSTLEWMQLFYEALYEHKQTKANALQAAHQRFIQQTTHRYSHPYYWASFNLIGDTGEIPSSAFQISKTYG